MYRNERYCRLDDIIATCSEHGSRNEDEQNAQSGGDKEANGHSCGRSLVQEFAHVRLTNWRPVHKRVLTVPEECHHWIDPVLVCDDEIGGNCKW